MKFKAIAMKCNEEQFKAIEPKLLADGCMIENISLLDRYPYLTNNYQGGDYRISNIGNDVKDQKNREAHEQWNEEVFLEACGIETFTITKDTALKYEMKEEFPQLFALESGKWLKNSDYPLWMVYVVDDGSHFGFNANGAWFNRCSSASGVEICENILNSKNNSYATFEEVKIRLTDEAEKRGFVKGVRFTSVVGSSPEEFIYTHPRFNGNEATMIWNSLGGIIFNSGVWAEVVKKIAPEDNNGWTKIYDESDLPTEDGVYEVILNKTQFRATLPEIIRGCNNITHWRKQTLLPIE
jgi:hypothetical protein